MTSNRVKLTLSLDSYERSLLDEFSSVFAKPAKLHQSGDDHMDIEDVFHRWMWYRKVADNFWDVTHIPVVIKDWGGDLERGFRLFLHFLHYNAYDFLYFRTSKLKTDNPHFVEHLVQARNMQVTSLDISPSSTDQKHWEMLVELDKEYFYGVADRTIHDIMAQMISEEEIVGKEIEAGNREEGDEDEDEDEDEDDNGDDEDEDEQVEGERAENRMGLGFPLWKDVNSEDEDADSKDEDDPYIPFSVWTLIRKSSILRRREDNDTLVLQCLNELEFFSYYLQITNDLYSRSPERKDWIDGISAQITHIGLAHALSRFAIDGYFVIEDPRQFIEFIPWEELGISDATESEGTSGLWNPQKTPLHHDHHLFTEEEVYRFCITNHYTFPGHFQGGKVVFKMSPLKDTTFIRDIHQFWLKWNDCAITLDPISKDWILLETVPGQTFRRLWNLQDRHAALNYFRKLIDGIRYGYPVSSVEALKLNFRPEYENLLDIIPLDQFLIPEQEPKRGSRGVVYQAIWKCPHKIGMAASDDLHVVLKAIVTNSHEEQNDILKELDVNFKALQGLSPGFTKLHGVTCVPTQLPSGCILPPDLTGMIFIVTERALEGPAFDYIKNRLTGSILDWEMMLRFIGDIVSGLLTIHSHGVLHRDLHWGNVLMTTRGNRKDLLHSVQSKDGDLRSILIADLGEGKVIGGTSTIGRVYGYKEYRAPEIEKLGNEAYSPAADMYSFGRLVECLICEHWKIAKQKGDNRRMIPKTLWNIMDLLRRANPSDRPPTKHVSAQLEGLWKECSSGYDFVPDKLDLIEFHDRTEPEDLYDEIPF